MCIDSMDDNVRDLPWHRPIETDQDRKLTAKTFVSLFALVILGIGDFVYIVSDNTSISKKNIVAGSILGVATLVSLITFCVFVKKCTVDEPPQGFTNYA